MKRLLCLGFVLLAGCSPTPPAPAPTTGTSTTAPGFPMTVTDGLGRSVKLKAPPKRIVSLAPNLTEILYAIGAGDRIVAVTNVESYPPEVKKLPNVGGFTAKMLNLEAVLSHNPDLIVADSGIQEPIVEMLTKQGLTVYAQNPKSFDDVATVIAAMGTITGTPDKANEVAANFRKRFQSVQERTAKIAEKDRPKVLYVLADEPLMSVGSTSFIGQMVTLAGGVNVFADVQQQYPRINDEAVLLRKPDLILAPDHGDTEIVNRIARRPGWNTLTAVQQKRIYTLNGDLVSRAGPRLIDGLEAMEKILHPKP